MSRTLRSRLARTLGLTAALSVAAAAVFALALVRRFTQQDALRQLRSHADAVQTEAGSLELGQAAGLRRLLVSTGDQVAFIGPRGGVRGDAAAQDVARAIDVAVVLGGTSMSGSVRIASGQYVYVAVPVTGARGNTAAALLARPSGLARDVWGPVFVRLLLAGAVAVAIALAVSSALARRLTEPLRGLVLATSRLAGGDLAHRVPVEGDEEAAQVARGFNAMADSLQEARRREHEFLASVSHELRTPITAIRGYAEAIADGAVTPGAELDAAVAVIHDESARLERLVQDVVDLGRLGAKEFRLEPVDVDLAPTLADALKALEPAAQHAGVTFELDAPAPLRVRTDANRVRQIIANLVENALRVTPGDGRITVRGRAEGDVIAIEVRDTGPGIATEDLPHVFERSYLWSRSKGRHNVGTGLGLAIVRELATALGATVSVSSTPGVGTTFTLRVPSR